MTNMRIGRTEHGDDVFATDEVAEILDRVKGPELSVDEIGRRGADMVDQVLNIPEIKETFGMLAGVSAKVSPLKALARTPDPECVILAKELLAKAERGDITGLVYAAADEAGVTSQGVAGMVWTARMVGSIEMLKCQMLIEQRERTG